MFPSSDPATQFPASSEAEAEEPDIHAPDYPGDQQKTHYQWIGGNEISGYDQEDPFEHKNRHQSAHQHDVPQGLDDETASIGWPEDHSAAISGRKEAQFQEQLPSESGYQYAEPSIEPGFHYFYHANTPDNSQSDLHITNDGFQFRPWPYYQENTNPESSGWIHRSSKGAYDYQPVKSVFNAEGDIADEDGFDDDENEYFQNESNDTPRTTRPPEIAVTQADSTADDAILADTDGSQRSDLQESNLNVAKTKYQMKSCPGHLLKQGASTKAGRYEGGNDEAFLDANLELLDRQEQSSSDDNSGGSDFISGEDRRYGRSPTESQLAAEGFEFHNQLPEEIQMAYFNDKAFRKALRELEPDLPRKQQWHAWRTVVEMLNRLEYPSDDEGYDPLQPQRGFPADQSGTQPCCQCGGDASRCTCAPGQCDCAGCPQDHPDSKKFAETTRSAHQAHVEDDEGDAPMDIGTTSVTPRFPNLYDKYGIQKIPGLGQLPQESEDSEDHQSPPQQKSQNHRCQCGNDCRCPSGGRQCPLLSDSAEPRHYTEDRLAEQPQGWETKTAAKAQPSLDYGLRVVPTPPEQPNAATNPPSSAHERSYYTPQQGFSFVRSNHSSEASTPLGTPPQMTPIPPSRPDTPRPLDSDVRQSVEPEMPLPNWHRESTPAYTDRSPSPSPISRHGDFDVPNDLDRMDGIDDIAMRDITPTVHASRAFHRSREGSAPSSPSSFSRSRFSVPRTSGPIYPSSPSRHLMPAPRSPRQDSQPPSLRRFYDISRGHTLAPVPLPDSKLIPAPPIPSYPTIIKPGKQRDKDKDKSRRKSGVQGSKIEKPKSRNITAKQRKATEQIVKQDTMDKKEAGAGAKKRDGKVAKAVEKIEERLQGNGTSPRRSERIKKRVISGSPRLEYRGMGG